MDDFIMLAKESSKISILQSHEHCLSKITPKCRGPNVVVPKGSRPNLS